MTCPYLDDITSIGNNDHVIWCKAKYEALGFDVTKRKFDKWVNDYCLGNYNNCPHFKEEDNG